MKLSPDSVELIVFEQKSLPPEAELVIDGDISAPLRRDAGKNRFQGILEFPAHQLSGEYHPIYGT